MVPTPKETLMYFQGAGKLRLASAKHICPQAAAENVHSLSHGPPGSLLSSTKDNFKDVDERNILHYAKAVLRKKWAAKGKAADAEEQAKQSSLKSSTSSLTNREVERQKRS